MSPQPSPTHEIPVESLQKENYIRTYAMDLAKATQGKQASSTDDTQSRHSFFNSLKTSLHSSQGDGVHEDPQTSDSLIVHDTDSQTDPDLAVLEREAEQRDQQAMLAQKEISDELSSLSAESTQFSDLAGGVEIKPEPKSFVNVPTPPEPRKPQDLPRKDESAAEPSRESILERLRNRAGENKSDYKAQRLEPIQTQKIEHTFESAAPAPVEPLPVPPTELSLPTPEQDVPAIAWPTPTTPEPVIIAPQPEVIAPAPIEPAPEPFHSFSSDFADRVDATQASTFSVLAAQNDAPVRAATPTRRIEWLPILAGFVLIVGAGIGGTFAYQFMQKTAPISEAADTIPSLITPDEKVLLTGDNLGLSLNQEMSEAIPDGHVLLTYIRTPITTAGGTVQVPQSGEVLFGKLGLNIPSILLRNVEAPSSVGVIHAGNQTRPFFLLKVSSYQRTFLGMLDWESTIAEDLSEYYPAYDTNQSVDSSTRFSDDIIASHSVRVLRDAQGRSIMLYGYTANKEVLIIARDEASFAILLSRLSASGN